MEWFAEIEEIKKAVHIVSLCKPTSSAVGRRPKVEAFFDLRSVTKEVAKVCFVNRSLSEGLLHFSKVVEYSSRAKWNNVKCTDCDVNIQYSYKSINLTCALCPEPLSRFFCEQLIAGIRRQAF